MKRRTFTIAAGTAATLGVAGCLDDDAEGPGIPGDDADLDGNDTIDGDSDDGIGHDDGDWEDVDEIHLEGSTTAWVGVLPEHIEGEENPTLVLFEGESYTISFENTDGETHNLAIRDENEEVVEDHVTNDVDEEGEEGTLSNVQATDAMVTYVCEYHPETMVGEIQIDAAENGDDGFDTDDEDNATNDDENGDDGLGTDDEEDGENNSTESGY